MKITNLINRYSFYFQRKELIHLNGSRLNKVKRIRQIKKDQVSEQVKNILQKSDQQIILMVRN